MRDACLVGYVKLRFSTPPSPPLPPPRRIGGQTTVGRDSDNKDGPDQPLRFEFEGTDTVVQFPLGFCPSAKDTGFIKKDGVCKGRWGFVIKQWETITAVRDVKDQWLPNQYR